MRTCQQMVLTMPETALDSEPAGGIVDEQQLCAVAWVLASPGCLKDVNRAEASLIAKADESPPSVAVERAAAAIRSGEDPLGTAFASLRSAAQRRKMGATYTPASLIGPMSEWLANHKRASRVVDPGAGSARFLVAAGRLLPEARLVAVEIDPLASLIARANLTALGFDERSEVHTADFRSLKLAPGPGREQGIEVDALEDVSHAKIACVTPSHQFPTGAVLSLTRRLELLNWASQRGAVILEDDYDGEFRYAGRPIQCLQSLDQSGSVIYAGSASKMMFPSLRIGWAVVPESLVETFHQLKFMTDRDSVTLEQLAFADFIREGALDRHIRRIRKRQTSRRNTLVDAVHRELGDRVELLGTSAGFHALVRLRDLRSDQFPLLRDACRRRSVGIYSAARHYDKAPAHMELVLGYASLSEEDINTGVGRFRKALDAVG